MRILTCKELLSALCRQTEKFGILVRLDPNNRTLALYLEPFEEDDEECQQIVADGMGFLMFKTKEDMQKVFEQMKKHKHIFYASECNSKGQDERNTYDS